MNEKNKIEKEDYERIIDDQEKLHDILNQLANKEKKTKKYKKIIAYFLPKIYIISYLFIFLVLIVILVFLSSELEFLYLILIIGIFLIITILEEKNRKISF